MALSPLQEYERFEETTAQTESSKTYHFDFTTGQFTGKLIDGEEALLQFIHKAIKTARFRYLIYDDQYGCELEDLIGQDISNELLETEIPRLITEALIYDDRIELVRNFSVVREKDKLYVSFEVVGKDETVLNVSEVI
ncbi:DUF2634 domain-containing protein [Fredinandcohnia humi]